MGALGAVSMTRQVRRNSTCSFRTRKTGSTARIPTLPPSVKEMSLRSRGGSSGLTRYGRAITC